jgi:gentisate 1,2-dioxygenase
MSTDRLAALEEKLLQAGVPGLWMRAGQFPPEEPRIQKWSVMYPLLREAGEAVPMEHAERRTMGGTQIVMPGERAPAHRHTMSAMRMVIMGDGSAYSIAEGEKMFMEPGDLLVQPNWAWHDHTNFGTEPVIWMDMLDSALVRLLGANFTEEWPEDGREQPASHPQGYHTEVYGQLRPPRLVGAPAAMPPVTYKFKDTLAMLKRMEAEEEFDPYDGIILEYTNPVTGGHTLPTMSARVQMLRPGEATRAHRHTGTVRYHVIGGQGVTTIDRENPMQMEWEDHDTFWVPSWRWHAHRNTSRTDPAILFTISDAPIAEIFNLYREERG